MNSKPYAFNRDESYTTHAGFPRCDPMGGSHFIMQTSKFLVIDATALTLGQGHGKVIQYISPDPYILCAKYLRFRPNCFDMRGKSCCGRSGGGGHGGGGCGGGGNELKT